MMYVYELEISSAEEGGYLVTSFDMEGATSGATLQEAYQYGADWLRAHLEHCEMHQLPVPAATYGNAPRNGGTVAVFVVIAGIETIPRVSLAEAARRLGVTPGRITQMLANNLLESFEADGRKWITVHSIEARLAEQPKAGRPKKLKPEEPSPLTLR